MAAHDAFGLCALPQASGNAVVDAAEHGHHHHDESSRSAPKWIRNDTARAAALRRIDRTGHAAIATCFANQRAIVAGRATHHIHPKEKRHDRVTERHQCVDLPERGRAAGHELRQRQQLLSVAASVQNLRRPRLSRHRFF